MPKEFTLETKRTQTFREVTVAIEVDLTPWPEHEREKLRDLLTDPKFADLREEAIVDWICGGNFHDVP